MTKNKKSENYKVKNSEPANEALSVADSHEVISLAKQALETDPQIIDTLLAELDTYDSYEERITQLIMIIQAAEDALGGKEFIKENLGHFWGMVQTRPYMRARECHAHLLHATGDLRASISVFEEMLTLNPNDNQGVRYELIGLYLAVGSAKEMRGLLERYDEPTSAVFAWATVFERLLGGNETAAKLALKNARKINPFAELYLTGEKLAPKEIPTHYCLGDENEAIIVTLSLATALLENQDMLDWLFVQIPSQMPTTTSSHKTGRNESCPCGSKKKYKHCCMNTKHVSQSTGHSLASEKALLEMQIELEKQGIDTEKDLDAYLKEFNKNSNAKPVDDFCGLSSNQMQQLLYSPFESPNVVEFKTTLDTQPIARVVTLFRGIVESIGEGGTRSTARGNLPLKAVNQIAQTYVDEFGEDVLFFGSSFSSEFDFRDLFKTRFLAQESGLICFEKNRFTLSNECKSILAGDGMKVIYPRLLHTHTMKLDWRSEDGYPDIDSIQTAFGYSLFLLNRFGNRKHKVSFYVDAFLKAFPMVVEEATPTSYATLEGVIGNAYSTRFIERFAEYFGLIEIEPDALRYGSSSGKLRTTPLLSSAISFKVP